MSRQFLHVALWLALAITSSNGKVCVLFSENLPGTYFKTTEQSHGHLTKDDLTATAASLLNVGAFSHIGADTASKVTSSTEAAVSLVYKIPQKPRRLSEPLKKVNTSIKIYTKEASTLFLAQVAGIVKASPFEKPGAVAAFVLGSIHEGGTPFFPMS